MAQLLDRARQLVAAGPHDAALAEIAAVHDAIWPAKAPVCPTNLCRQVLGVAFYAIKRWVEQQQGAAGDLAPSSSFMSTKTASAARFKEGIFHTPHGLGVTYSNANLTEKAALDILENDPDAAQFFDVLPAGYVPPKPAEDGDEGDDKGDAPKLLALARANKDQLVAAHLSEVGSEAPAEATNDELRQAIATARAANENA